MRRSFREVDFALLAFLSQSYYERHTKIWMMGSVPRAVASGAPATDLSRKSRYRSRY
jgi:hypothetical protein